MKNVEKFIDIIEDMYARPLEEVYGLVKKTDSIKMYLELCAGSSHDSTVDFIGTDCCIIMATIYAKHCK